MGREQPLAGKVAVVTGASQGIGAVIAQAMADAGATVVLAARNAVALEARAAQALASGGAAVARPTDVTSEDGVADLFAYVHGRWGRLDALVNNAAGGGRPPAPLAQWTSAEFDAAVAVNLRGTFLCTKYALPLLEAAGGGAIVNLSSTAGEQGVSGLAGYVATKYAIGGLTRVTALDYASAGIRVNAVAPGPILTERMAASGPEAQRRVGAAVPLGRAGRMEEVAAAVVWLCSDAASFVTGAIVPVDGGRLAGVPSFATMAGRPGRTDAAAG